ncbi:precorrin-8X methylmutase [Pleurocapsales cyanobacterium LEGE 06147]|nr:precorrin-8X methylmutase [Pleurocapsales cyanobacterium LEGE 06147]
MDLHLTDVQSLAIIDREVARHQLSPAEYEIVRQVIYSTGDFDYLSLLHFSTESLARGAAALAAQTSIIVDVPMIQIAIGALLQKTFGNPVYCTTTAITRPQNRKTQAAWGLETLAKSHPEAIFVIGQEQTALTSLVELSKRKVIQPALIIATAPVFVEQDMKEWFQNSSLDRIYVDNRKGSAVVATAIVSSLIELSWQAYQLNSRSV